MTKSNAYDFGFECGSNEYMHHATFHSQAKQSMASDEYTEAVKGFKDARAMAKKKAA